MTPNPASGEQHWIRFGAYEACVASVGATLRSLTEQGRDLIVPFDADEIRPGMRGAVLAPWPNRVADGRYVFDGVAHQLPINEPERANAAHGLVAWLSFDLVDRTVSALKLETTIQPQPGYPWRVRVRVEFELGSWGLRQRIRATNESESEAPIGLGGHPYVVAGPVGPGAVDDWSLELPATEVMLVSADRLLPVGIADVTLHDGGSLDFRVGRTICGTVINHAFTSLRAGADGRAHVRVSSGDRGIDIACDPSVDWVQVYTAESFTSDSNRHALAVEPMTCPPDALNNGRDLRVLRPGGSTHIEWTIGVFAQDGPRHVCGA
ncbi:aldose 1-epimerase family protein [Mycetocola sp. 2940]|uniref:aldose 1-epimerase family protein n=1 Tax=Mycetocola sp. 2940 TaxID=3156452 RepID=UPI003396C8BB